jgi:hypothetical protein
VVGDSIAGNLSFGLEHVHQKYGFDLLSWAAQGCSIAVGGTMRWPGDGSQHGFAGVCYNRRDGLAGAIRDFDPDVVLVESSIFDILDRKIDGWGDFSSVANEPMASWLQGQNRSVVNTLAAGGATVVWATVPCAQFNPALPNHHENCEGNRRIELLNQKIRQLGVAIADLRARICPGGQFTQTIEGSPLGRPDGVHFSEDAAKRLADNWLAPLLLSHV